MAERQASVRLHAYAASFGGDLAGELISQNAKKGGRFLDPWAGSGTGLIQASFLGVNSIGIDIDPIACLIARVSLTPYGVDELETISSKVSERLNLIEAALCELEFSDCTWASGTRFSLAGFDGKVPAGDFIDFWFAPVQRAILCMLVGLAQSFADARHQALLFLAISSSIIRKWPNTISQAMDIDHSRPHRRIRDDLTVTSQSKVFKKAFHEIITRLGRINKLGDEHHSSWEIKQGDTRKELENLNQRSIDYILTSPPYFNAIDYPRAHKFSQWWIWPERQPPSRSSYLGLMPGGNDEEAVQKCRFLVPDYLDELDSLSKISAPTYKSLCKYIVELNEVVVQFPRILKKHGKVTLVVGDNVVRGIRIPISRMLGTMLRNCGLSEVGVTPRLIKHNRRRYPYGISGFKGIMETEYIVSASR